MMRGRSFLLGLGSVIGLLLAAGQARACSSCGSGGADPVILNPYEHHKLYLGLGAQSGFQDIDQHGSVRKSYGPSAKQTLDLAYAERLHPRFFVSGVANFGRNAYGSESVMQNGDLTLNARGTVLLQNIADPLIPQIQVLLSHRFAVARSVYDQKREHGLDVFGAGYDESTAGLDVWYGMSPVMVGGSVLFGFPGAASSDAGRVQPGRLQRSILTLGGMPAESMKLMGGLIQEQRGGFALDGAAQPDSDRRSHDVFLTWETLYAEGSNYRATLNRRAVWGENRNAVRATSLTLAWMRAL